MIIGILAAIINGATLPFTAAVFAQFYSNFKYAHQNNFISVADDLIIKSFILGIILFLSGWIMTTTFVISG